MRVSSGSYVTVDEGILGPIRLGPERQVQGAFAPRDLSAVAARSKLGILLVTCLCRKFTGDLV